MLHHPWRSVSQLQNRSIVEIVNAPEKHKSTPPAIHQRYYNRIVESMLDMVSRALF